MRELECVLSRGAPGLVALAYAAWLVKRPAQLARSQQLNEFSVRPNERHRRAACLPGKEAVNGDRIAVPDLFRDHAAGTRHCRHCREVGQRIVAGAQLEMA